MKLRWLTTALSDLQAIKDYISEEIPQLRSASLNIFVSKPEYYSNNPVSEEQDE